MLSRLVAYVRGIAQRRQVGAEVDDELRFHVEQEIQANVARGMSPAEVKGNLSPKFRQPFAVTVV